MLRFHVTLEFKKPYEGIDVGHFFKIHWEYRMINLIAIQDNILVKTTIFVYRIKGKDFFNHS